MQHVSQPAERDVQNWLLSVQCPVTLQPLQKAVVLVPCGHSLSKSIAKTMFGKAQNLQIATAGNCPSCRKQVVTYVPNYALRDVVSGLMIRVEESAATVLPCVVMRIAQESPVVPFPGKGAKFECCSAWDKISYPSAWLQRSMSLTSTTPDSFLTEVSVTGYSNGNVKIRICCRLSHDYFQRNSDEDIFKKYISDSGFQPHVPASSFYAESPAALKWALKILADNNELPESEFQFIKRLVEAKEWPVVEREMNLFQPSLPASVPASQTTEQKK